MNALHAIVAIAVAASPAFAQFSWDPVSGACVDVAGQRGLNVGLRGACGDLRGANLEGADLSRLDLRGARFDAANLRGASLLHSNLRGASFENADLSKAVLSGAKLDGATLSGARLVGAHLEHASLSQAMLVGADVRNACLYRTGFEGADLRSALFSRSRALVEGARWTRALVDAQTLPFDANELAALEVQIAPAALELSRL